MSIDIIRQAMVFGQVALQMRLFSN